MKFFFDGLRQALHLLTHPDAALVQILKVTLQVAVGSTLIALAIGLPLGLYYDGYMLFPHLNL